VRRVVIKTFQVSPTLYNTFINTAVFCLDPSVWLSTYSNRFCRGGRETQLIR